MISSFQNWKPRSKCLLIGLLLALGTAALYWPVAHHQFIHFDDDIYIVGNPHVTSGLTWTNIVWAFESGASANWHPATWISHMIDYDLYGLNPGGHHLTNLFFHIANSLLLFFLLNKMTGAMWRSAFVAALFAWHPLHVESVAWAAERKDTLSAFFWLLTLLAYSRYAEKPGMVSYISALLFFMLGLMSKPMVVTLPFVLLLMDFWPLERISNLKFQVSNAGKNLCPPVTALRILLEKIPFFMLALAASVTTFLVQKAAGAMASLTWELRLENVALAYARYISKLFWPQDLAIVYPFPHQWPASLAAGAALLLLFLTTLTFFRARQNPYLPVGWLWFLGTLVPVIGLVQVGAQSIADRYTYIPGIGFFIVVVWGAHDLAQHWPKMEKFLPLAGIIALLGCLGVTSIQINYWHDSEKLFLHAINVTTDNYVVENCLGETYEKAGRKDRALVLYADAVKIEPRYPLSQFNLALCLLGYGKTNEALEHLQIAASLQPHDADIQYDLAVYFMQHGNPSAAAHQFRVALTERPDFPEALNELAWILATDPNPANRSGAEAVQFARRACDLTQNQQPVFLETLAAAYAEIGQFDQAIKTLQISSSLAISTDKNEIAAKNAELLKIFQDGHPFHER